VDILKIDRSFVERLSATNGQESLVHSIVQLGQTLQLETIAEGIEDHRQLLALRRLGADMAQGYHFGRPGPPGAVTDQLLEHLAGDAGGPAADPAARAGIVEAAVDAVGMAVLAAGPTREAAVPAPPRPRPGPGRGGRPGGRVTDPPPDAADPGARRI